MNTAHSIPNALSVCGRAKGRFRRAGLLTVSLGLLACGDKSMGSPDAAVTQPPDAAVTQPQPVVGTFKIADATGAGIQGAEVTYKSQKKTTDTNGNATIDLPPGAPYEVIAKATGFPPLHIYGIAGSAAFSLGRGLYTDTQLTQLAGALGTTYDMTKAIISVVVVGANLDYLPESIAIDTSVTYGFALVPDPSSPVGFTKSNATLPGKPSEVYLVNVTPGAVPLKVTPPAGKSCTVYPSAMPQGTEALVGYAHEISTVQLVCK